MDPNSAIVSPIRAAHAPQLPALAFMVSTRKDLEILCRLLNLNVDGYRRLYISRLYLDQHPACRFALVGPLVGAPYAVMVLETMIAWGAANFIFFGWCGAISRQLRIGDLVLPTEAVIDEGTTRHYFEDDRRTAHPSETTTAAIRSELSRLKVDFQEGRIWTTDGIFRETIEKVIRHQANDVLGVEMELSALFSVGAYRHVDVGGLLVVSDDLSALQWHPGFMEERFKNGQQIARQCLVDLIARLGNTNE